MKLQLLVTGAGGFVAGSVLTQSESHWDAHAISRQKQGDAPAHIKWHKCDPLNPAELRNAFHAARPDAVIHCAAIADIDVSEQNQELARAVNVTFTKHLVVLCADTGCRLIHCSTDNVFDGEHAPYSETDIPSPVNYYGRTKVEAEEAVKPLGQRGVIARLAIVVGLPLMGSGNSFLAKMIASLKNGLPVIVPAREVRTPVDVVTAGKALLELAAGNQTGIFHLSGNERLNRLEMAQRIARFARFNPDLIKAQPGAHPPSRAPRPRDVSLNNERTREQLKTDMLRFDEALETVFRST